MPRLFKLLLLSSLISLFATRCGSASSETVPVGENDYACYFALSKNERGEQLLTIHETWDNSNKQQVYRLVDRNDRKNGDFADDEIAVPLERVVCMSTSHIAYISALDMEQSIIAVSGSHYISNTLVVGQVEMGSIKDIGYEGSLDYELLIALKPDIVLTYGISGENNLYIKKLKELNIKHIIIGDYMESHPLGKTEYLKLFGALYGCQELADSVYSRIKENYLNIKDSIPTNSPQKPRVLLNAPWKDVWYIPDKNNYMSLLIEDAGGEVIGRRRASRQTSSAHNFEEIMQEAYNADYWLNPNNYASLKELSAVNPLFSKLPVFQLGRVYNNIKQNTPEGGSNFWEKGVVEPDIILKDLINILHPERHSDGVELSYYIELK